MRTSLWLLALAGAVLLGAASERSDARWRALAPERAVAALPGVGAGWLDTLRRIAGPATIDTITAPMLADYGDGLLGVFEPWHMIIEIRVNMLAYYRDVRKLCSGARSFGYEHPATTTIRRRS
jgi:hypothetical protein